MRIFPLTCGKYGNFHYDFMEKLKSIEKRSLVETGRKVVQCDYPIVGPSNLNMAQSPTSTAVRNDPKKIMVSWLDCMAFSFVLSIEFNMVFSSFLL